MKLYRENHGHSNAINRSKVKKIKREIVKRDPRFANIRDEILNEYKSKNLSSEPEKKKQDRSSTVSDKDKEQMSDEGDEVI